MNRVVAFAKDWDDVPTCITHVVRGLSATREVLWLNSIGTRKPALTSSRDLARIRARIQRVFRSSEIKQPHLRVQAPLLIPKVESPLARWVNRAIFRLQTHRELERMGNGRVEYWVGAPNAVDLLPEKTGDNVVIYYCVDDWSQFPQMGGEWLARKEAQLLERADIVFTPARHLEGKLRAMGATKVHYIPHGVDYALFRFAAEGQLVVPQDIADLPRPVIGFYGNVHSWIDFALVRDLAKARPSWTFVLIGQVYCDVSILQDCPNVRLLGRREHAALPSYCQGMSAAMIPYDLSDVRMESVNPVKTKELLAAGVPVVASDIPELRGYGQDVLTCRSQDEWIRALEVQVARSDRRGISERMRPHDWSARIDDMVRIVDAV